MTEFEIEKDERLIEFWKEKNQIVKEYLANPTKVPLTKDGYPILNAISNKCLFGSCDGTGYMLYVENDEARMGACECNLRHETRSKYEKANIPKLYKNLTVDSFDVTLYEKTVEMKKAVNAKQMAIDYVQNYRNYVDGNMGLYLYSHTKGSGKTRLAISVLTALFKLYNIDGLYSSEYEMLDSIKATFSSSTSYSTKDVIDRYSKAEVLIIDDFGLEKQTDWVQSTFTKIIDERLSNNRLTIFTSNLTFKEVRSIYKNDRFISRLESMSLFIEMPEEDIRIKLAKIKKDAILKGVLK